MLALSRGYVCLFIHLRPKTSEQPLRAMSPFKQGEFTSFVDVKVVTHLSLLLNPE